MSARSTRAARGGPRLSCAALCAAVCACANPGSELVADDSDSRFGGLRASWEVPRPVQSDGRPPARQILMQLEVSTSDSDDQQSLEPGESVTVDGTTFVGPSALSTGFDLHLTTRFSDGRVHNFTWRGLRLDNTTLERVLALAPARVS